MPTTVTLSGQELATVIAALRYWQKNYGDVAMLAGREFYDIAVNSGEFPPLSLQKIDALCERINVAGDEPRAVNATSKLYRLIAACQEVSEMAPKPEVPEIEDMKDLDPSQAEGLAYDAGLYHAAEKVRLSLRSIGIEPAEGTTEWYHEETVDA
jgi:hypothetical protein